MTLMLIGIGMAIVVVGLVVAVLLCGRTTTPQQRAVAAPPRELRTPAARPDWSDEHLRSFADTVPNLRFAAIAEAADEQAAKAFARLPEPEDPLPEGDPQP